MYIRVVVEARAALVVVRVRWYSAAGKSFTLYLAFQRRLARVKNADERRVFAFVGARALWLLHPSSSSRSRTSPRGTRPRAYDFDF